MVKFKIKKYGLLSKEDFIPKACWTREFLNIISRLEQGMLFWCVKWHLTNHVEFLGTLLCNSLICFAVPGACFLNITWFLQLVVSMLPSWMCFNANVLYVPAHVCAQIWWRRGKSRFVFLLMKKSWVCVLMHCLQNHFPLLLWTRLVLPLGNQTEDWTDFLPFFEVGCNFSS